MKKLYSLLSFTLLSALSLTSCSRSEYAFRSGTGAYHTTEKTTAQVAPSTAAPVIETPHVEDSTPVTPVAAGKAVVHTARVKSEATVTNTKPAKLNAVQKAVVTKLAKHVAKKSEVASAHQTQSKAGKAAVVTLIGLVLLLLGVAGVPIVGLIGLIAFIVGIILLIIALVNG
jgi:hypothetical protein